MKGLLIKDFKLLKSETRSFIIGAVSLSVVYYFISGGNLGEGAGFYIGYMSFLGMSVALRTISIDKEDNSETFLFSLPISRKTYILEKYVFCFTVGILIFLLTAVCAMIVCLFNLNIVETLYTAAALFPLMIALIDIMIPIELKFGSGISRIIFVILILAAAFLFYIMGFFLAYFADQIPFLAEMSYEQLLLYLYLFGVVATWISIKVSERIINRKEF